MPYGDRYVSFVVKFLYWAFVTATAYLVLKYAVFWIMPFLIAFIMATVLEKPVNVLTKKLKLSRRAASAVCTVGAYFSIIFLLYTVFAGVIVQLKDFLEYIPTAVEKLTQSFERYGQIIENSLPQEISEMINDAAESIKNGFSFPTEKILGIFVHIKNIASYIPSLLLSVFVSAVSTYLISSDYKNISDYVKKMLPKGAVAAISKTRSYMISNVLCWLKAQLHLIMITFAELVIGFIIIRAEYAGIVAALTALIDALPVFGVGTVLIPWALVSMISGDYVRAVSLIIIYAVVALVRSVTEPHIVGKSIGLHPLASIISVYVGFEFFGILGMFFMPLLVITAVQLVKSGYVPILPPTDKVN